MLVRRIFLAAALLISTPVIALAARGYVTSDVNMRAGPGTGYPVVDLIPADAHVIIHGCLNDYAWCDVSWRGDRGWVSADYLDYFYRNRYVYFPDYVNVIDAPIVTFSLGTYWNDYYIGRPWYGRLSYWQGYWRSHGRYGYSATKRGNRSVAVHNHVTNYHRLRGNRPVELHNRATNYSKARGNRSVARHHRVTNGTRVESSRTRTIRASSQNHSHPNYIRRGHNAPNQNVTGRIAIHHNPHVGRANRSGMHANAAARETVGAGPHVSVGHGNAGHAVNKAAHNAKRDGKH